VLVGGAGECREGGDLVATLVDAGLMSVGILGDLGARMVKAGAACWRGW